MHCVPTAPPLWFTPYCVSSCMYDYIYVVSLDLVRLLAVVLCVQCAIH